MKRIFRTNSRQRQSRAIVNLQQLSQSPWHQAYEQDPIHQPIPQQKTYTNTIQSTQLPLNPKQPSHRPNRPIYSINKLRPNTIHNHSIQRESQASKCSKNKNNGMPLTSLNFYEDNRKKAYNTFDCRSRLNQETQLFASKIKYQQQLLKSIESRRTQTGNQKNPKNLPFKASVANRSLFYKQFKSFLVDSFKIKGKPVQITRDRYSIESHGLPKKKSIYSFKEREQNYSFLNKTDLLLKKVGRYDMQNAEENNSTIKSNSFHNSSDYSSFVSQTINLRGNDTEQKRKTKGKLWLGRPPTTLVLQDT